LLDVGAPADLMHIYGAGVPSAADGREPSRAGQSLHRHKRRKTLYSRRHQGDAELENRDECIKRSDRLTWALLDKHLTSKHVLG